MKATLEELPREGKTRRWRVRVDNGFDPHGRRDRRYFRFDGTRADADAFLRDKVDEVERRVTVEAKRLTTGRYLLDWLEGRRPQLARTTFQGYRHIVMKQLVPGLGEIPLMRLEPRHVRTFYARQLAPLGEGAGLSPQSVVHSHRVLHKALRDAVVEGLLSNDPLLGVQPPKVQRNEMHALEESESLRLLSALEGSTLYLPVLLALQTGMRRGELLGLKWRDVDLGARTATVSRSLEQTREGIRFKEPKSRRSRRTIGLPALAVEALRDHKKAQAERRLLLARAYQDNNLILCRDDGSPWPPDLLSNAFTRARDRLGLPVRFHDLRHSYASQQLRQGVPPNVVSRNLGHSTIAFTLDVYSHVLPGMQEDAAAMMDSAYAEAQTRRVSGGF